MPELIEFVPRMVIDAEVLGSPEFDKTISPGTCPCIAWSKAGAGVLSMACDLIVATEPVIVPFS